MPAEPRRAVRPVVAWVVAAMAAVAVASWGVAHVGRSVTDSRPAPLSAAEVEERLAVAATTTTTTGPGGPPSTGSAAPAETTVPTSPGPSAPGGTVILGGPAVIAPQPSEPAPGSSPTTTVAAPPTTAAPAPAGETRTYALVGGTVSLRFEASGVTVAFANPAAGFEVEVEPEHGNGVKVEFESETHRSRVTGWWDGGPRDEVDERADDDD